MADPIPSADPALLAAQAKAGQAGVDAYKAAQNELQNQRQAALQQAMQEAALRGAPAGAVQSIGSTITAPYDQGINAMSQRSADFQAEMARRDRGLADYNSAVQSARSLIPVMTDQAVAPIRAQNEYNLRSQQIAGDRAIGEIDANTKLALAKLAAAVQAAKIKAAQEAAKANTPTHAELSGLMSEGASAIMNQGSSTIQGYLAKNQQDIMGGTQAMAQQLRAMPEQGAIAQAAGAKLSGQARDLDAQLAAKILISGLGAALSKPQTGGGGTGAFVFPDSGKGTNAGVPLSNDPSVAAMRAAIQGNPMISGKPRSGAAAPGPQGGGMVDGLNQAAIDRFQQGLAGSKELASTVAKIQAAKQKGQAVQNYGQQLGAAYLGQVLGAYGQGLNTHSLVDATTGQRVWLTPQQASDMVATDTGKFNYQTLANAPTSIASPEDYQAQIWGTPSEQNQGVPTQYSSQVMHDALVQAANALKAKGLNIDDAAIAGAMPAEISSPYNWNANRRGDQTSQQVYADAVKQGQVLGTPQGDKADAITKLNSSGFNAAAIPNTIGNDPAAAVSFLQQGQNAPLVSQAIDRLQKILQQWNADPAHTAKSGAKKGQLIQPDANALRDALRTAGVDRRIGEYALWHEGWLS